SSQRATASRESLSTPSVPGSWLLSTTAPSNSGTTAWALSSNASMSTMALFVELPSTLRSHCSCRLVTITRS
ncbi:hypothetical protein BGZ52_000417, partial [Haplosporangium bisporale]